ncbi:ABC transporter substrate-binding protein [Ottowia sp.]|uniref:ABC transporter substrate-binding protein n=1 Tax=Ottowia sp. TaxID=1898956 RepID=UPI0025DFEFE7|nr:ABC transporter substrate-binding protein [Ottowia sp.]MBK6613735.1 ABC transporter substrate-binding protein [Ottowia sp.]MBK6613743.1 ABC transporter substrate-binding protein [Ottowia sp.]MBK6613745.1 ABC transporter substrate-binding protein [Ottowia sp.]
MHIVSTILVIGLVAAGWAGQSKAEVREVVIALQPGLAYSAQMIMKDQGYVEANLAASGLTSTKVTYRTFGSGGAMNDAVLSGAAHFGASGVPAFITLWSRALGTKSESKGCIALDSEPTVALTRDSRIKTLRDIGEGDKISVPAVKVSIQAVLLQMAAAKMYGDSQYNQLDKHTVSLSHPDGLSVVLSGAEVGTVVAAIPYIDLGMQKGLRPIFHSYDVVDRNATTVLLWSGRKFQEENPATFNAVMEAFGRASSLIKSNPRLAAEIYLRVGKEKFTTEFIEKHYTDPAISFAPQPVGVQTFVDFMHRVGTVKQVGVKWEDLFFDGCKKYWGR